MYASWAFVFYDLNPFLAASSVNLDRHLATRNSNRIMTLSGGVDMLEYPFITMKRFPADFLKRIGNRGFISFSKFPSFTKFFYNRRSG